MIERASIFGKNTTNNGAVFFLVCHIKGVMMSKYIIACYVYLDCLVKLVYWFLYCKVIVFFSEVDKYHREDNLKMRKPGFSSNFSPPHLVSINRYCLQYSLSRYLPKSDFLFPIFLLSLLVEYLF